MRAKYCCDAKAYENYYLSQVGHGMPYFLVARVQQGYGLGNLFSSIAKSVLPLVKKGAKTLGKQVLQSGVEFASDVLHGKNVKQAAIDQARAAGSNLLQVAQHKNKKTKSSTEKSTKEKTQETSRHFLVNHGDVSTPQFGRIHHLSTGFVFGATKPN